MIAIPWNQIGKYGFAAVVALVVMIAYREDVVKPAQKQNERLVTVSEQQAKNEERQTAILKTISEDIGDIKDDQRKFPAVSEKTP